VWDPESLGGRIRAVEVERQKPGGAPANTFPKRRRSPGRVWKDELDQVDTFGYEKLTGGQSRYRGDGKLKSHTGGLGTLS